MTLASLRTPRWSGVVAAATLFIVASLVGGVANAAPSAGTFSVVSSTPCVKAGSTNTSITMVIKNTNAATSTNKIGSIFLDASKTNFSNITLATGTYTVPTGWTIRREDYYNSSDKTDLDGVYLIAPSTAPLAGQASITVSFQATIGSPTGAKTWTDSAWTGFTPKSGTAFTGTTNTVNVAATCTQSLTFTTAPSSTPAGGVMSNVAVKAWSGLLGTGSPVAGETITLSSTGLHNGSTATTNSSGIATFSGAGQLTVGTIAQAGYSMKAATGTINTTSPFNITNAPVNHVIITSPPSLTQVTSGGTLSGVNVMVTDQYSNAVNAAAVTFTSACLASPGSGTTNSGGSLTSALNLQVVAAKNPSCDLLATAVDPDSVHTATAHLSFAITAGSATNLTISTPPADTVANATMAPVVVTVTDGTNPVAGESVEVSSPCLQAPATDVTGADGTVSFGSLQVVTQVQQNCDLTAADTGSGTALPKDASFDVLPDVAANLTFEGPNGAQPTDTVVGEPIKSSSGDVAVYVTDQWGNPVADNTSVTLTIGTDPSNGLAGLTGGSASTSNGVASFPNPVIDTSSSGYTLHAEADGAGSSPDSSTFNVTSTASDCTICSTDIGNGSTVTGGPDTTLTVEGSDIVDCASVFSALNTTDAPPVGTGGKTPPFEGTVSVEVGSQYDANHPDPVIFRDPSDVVGLPSRQLYPSCEPIPGAPAGSHGAPAGQFPGQQIPACSVPVSASTFPCVSGQSFETPSLDLVTTVLYTFGDPPHKS